MQFTSYTFLLVSSFYLAFTTIFTAIASPLYRRGIVARQLLPCGVAFYNVSAYSCTNGTFLCPILEGTPTLQCGDACYLPSLYTCNNSTLGQVPNAINGTVPTNSTVPSNGTAPTRRSLNAFY